MDLPKAYDASRVEDEIYAAWERSGFFNPDHLPLTEGEMVAGQRGSREPFCLMMPPPNRTGTLHIGHAMGLAIQDLLTRFERMRGKKALWVPGTDHAAIATQVKVEQQLIKQGIKDPRRELGREKFLEAVVKFADASAKTINNQIRKMGASCDWSREAYTFDEPRSRAVNRMFKMMFEDGIIERGDRIVNWDPKMQTNVSDDEIEWVEERAPFYTFQYGPFEIGTSRPETKFGDKHVVIHPDDARYKKYKNGDTFSCEWINGPVTATIIKDKAVDPSFGTGVMTITPWHDAADFEIAERHGLKAEQVIDFDGKLLPIAGEFAGLSIEEARSRVVEKLKSKGLLKKIDEHYVHNVATSYRGGGVLEPQIKRQWFIRVNKKFKLRQDTLGTWKQGASVTLKALMTEAVKSKQTKIIPPQFEKVYFHWIQNLRDWCISRQIWFGHRIPVWYRGEELEVADTPPGKGWTQDPDTLDTWFSSGLWTFSTLGWPITNTIFVRHGEARSNVEDFLDEGSLGERNALTDAGRKQIQASAKKLKTLGVTAIVSSPVHRAKQTAEMIAKAVGATIVWDDRLRELGTGGRDGMTVEAFEKIRRGSSAWRAGQKPQTGIETRAAVVKRMREAVDRCIKQHAGETVAIVSHGDPMAALFESLGVADAWGQGYLKQGAIRMIPFDSALRMTSDESSDLAVFHPTSVLETGRDILFFWIARMILMSAYALGEAPFRDAYLHGLVLDEQGRKMSKSLENIIDPLDMIKKYGTDAVRLSLLIGTTPGQDVKLSEEKIAGYRNFTNKLWNISRFILMTMESGPRRATTRVAPTLADQWIGARLSDTVASVTKKLSSYQFSSAGEELRDFSWNDLADWYVEIAKVEGGKQAVLSDLLRSILKLWHPFMPFVTEHIWKLAGFGGALMIAPWPSPSDAASGKRQAASFDVLRQLVTDMRRLRKEQNVESAEFVACVIAADQKTRMVIEENQAWILRLARGSGFEFVKKIPPGVASVVSHDCVLALKRIQPDASVEREKLKQESLETARSIEALEAKLADKAFAAKAPASIVAGMRDKLAAARKKKQALDERRASGAH